MSYIERLKETTRDRDAKLQDERTLTKLKYIRKAVGEQAWGEVLVKSIKATFWNYWCGYRLVIPRHRSIDVSVTGDVVSFWVDGNHYSSFGKALLAAEKTGWWW